MEGILRVQSTSLAAMDDFEVGPETWQLETGKNSR